MKSLLINELIELRTNRIYILNLAFYIAVNLTILYYILNINIIHDLLSINTNFAGQLYLLLILFHSFIVSIIMGAKLQRKTVRFAHILGVSKKGKFITFYLLVFIQTIIFGSVFMLAFNTYNLMVNLHTNTHQLDLFIFQLILLLFILLYPIMFSSVIFLRKHRIVSIFISKAYFIFEMVINEVNILKTDNIERFSLNLPIQGITNLVYCTENGTKVKLVPVVHFSQL